MTFGEVLNYFKQQDNLESIVALVDEPVMRKAVAAWKGVEVRFKEGIGECPDSSSEFEMWKWLWSNVEVSPNEFGILAGVRVAEAEPLLQRVKALRLVFPDNTIAKRASDYLQAMMLGQLRNAKPEREHKSEQKKKVVGN